MTTAAAAEMDPVQVLEHPEGDLESLFRLRKECYLDSAEHKRIRELAAQARLDWKNARSPEGKEGAARKAGLGLWILGQFSEGAELLAEGGKSLAAVYALARCHLELGRFAEAARLLGPLANKGEGGSRFWLRMAHAEAQIEAGQLSAGDEEVRRLQQEYDQTGEFHYLLGRYWERQANHDRAMEEYERAVQFDAEHPRALFRLALNYDLFGQDEKAVELYERCRRLRPSYVHAVMNLGLLYEDRGSYEEAIDCYREVLSVDPNHSRARLYLRDSVASLDMYYDEELKKETEQRQQVLGTPITEFELSVRSRKCLEALGVGTLGDLVQKSEAELLQFRNFGQTSLDEIGNLLTQRGLKLGQKFEKASPGWYDLIYGTSQEDERLRKPISELNFSVRVMRCLARLKVYTVGDLAQKTASDLLACRNFGRTSMQEIESRLRPLGLSLKAE
jgi:DNA-directed RNA polymerase subunit alpha